VFTSGATEGNNAVLSWAARHPAGRPGVAISAIEHPSVREPAADSFGPEQVARLPVDTQGVLDLESLASLLRLRPPALVSVLAANNETGVLQPWRDAVRLCREAGVTFHCDAVQWIGKLPLQGLAEADFLTASGHKFGAPKGVGFIVVGQDQAGFKAQIGGGQ